MSTCRAQAFRRLTGLRAGVIDGEKPACRGTLALSPALCADGATVIWESLFTFTS
jgi:hypothetical protein